MTQFIRLTVTPLKSNGNVIYEYGEFETLGDMQDFSFNASMWSCRYISWHDVGQPYQLYFIAMIGPDYHMCPDGHFRTRGGALLDHKLDAMIILS